MDPCSYANVHQVQSTHLHLELTADFQQQVLHGAVTHTFNVQEVVDKVILDVKGLTITDITLLPEQSKLEYTIGEAHHDFGAALTISIPQQYQVKDASFKVRIAYSTSPSASAVQWLPPSQTSGKVHPYLFTQCQAIHCRSLVPVMDSPAVKAAYSAALTVPAPLVALMSARRLHDGQPINKTDATVTYEFEQPVPIPSYLIAFAIGDLHSRQIGPRSHVWSEKETVEAGAFEFAETEAFLQAAEDVCGPYAWGHYDLLLLPPSFPYGGMENPCLTFVTPTLLAGDRSLAGVVAHEIAHSWAGNLVTNRTWESFFLNEGFTVFIERKIEQRMYGRQYAQLKAILGEKSLRDAVNHYGHEHDFTCLCPRLQGCDPDDAFSSIPYEKGFQLLCCLQEIVGEEAMDKYLKCHFETFKFKTVTAEQWSEFFVNYFNQHGDATVIAALKAFDWDAWFHKPGMPIQKPQFDASLANAARYLACKWCGSATVDASVSVDDLKDWKSAQVCVFLERMENYQKEDFAKAEGDEQLANAKAAWRAKLEQIDSLYHFTDVKNSEIRFCWQILGLRAEWQAIVPHVVAFATGQGRMKFTRPLYKELFKVNKDLAVETFLKFRNNYHSICSKMVARDLQVA